MYLIKIALAVSLLETNIHDHATLFQINKVQTEGEEEALPRLLYFNCNIVHVSDFLVTRV